MTRFFAVLAAVFFTVSAARADYAHIDMTSTAPSTVTTAVGYTTAAEVALFSTCSVVARVQGVTGGTLDIYVQTFIKTVAGGFWTDVAHLPQLAAAAPLATYEFVLTRWSPSTSAITASLNTVDATPALAVNTVVPGLLGAKLRVVYKTGAGTTVGTSQVIAALCSAT
jgi:hypothetical protein